MQTNGLNLKRITNNTYSDYMLAFSPNGNKMVFGSSRKSLSDPDIYIINSNGTNEIQLTNDDKSRSPSFSPIGAKILFQSWRSGNTDIYTMNADGTDPVNISNSLDLAEENPYYSPDGTKIIFTVFIDMYYEYDVFIMDADGGNKTRLTYSRGNDYGVSW